MLFCLAHCRSLIQLRNQKHRAKHPTLETDVANLLGAMNFVASQIIAAGIPFGAAGGSKNGVASRAQNGLMFEDLLFTSASVLDPFTIAVDQVKQFLVVNNVNRYETSNLQEIQTISTNFGNQLASQYKSKHADDSCKPS